MQPLRGIFTVIAVTLGSVCLTTPALAQSEYGPDTCRQGYVWREAFPGDHVCVSPDTRTQAARDNRQAAARRESNGGAYGPDTCRQGYVWREASPDDHVCVTPETRAQAAADNAQAAARRASPSAVQPAPQPASRLERSTVVAPAHTSRVPSSSVRAPSSMAPGSMAWSARRYQLDSAAISGGSVKAVVDGRSEVVTPRNLAAKQAQDAVFVQHVQKNAVSVAVPDVLREQNISAPNGRALELGYLLTTKKAATRGVVRLKALVVQSTGLLFDGAARIYRGTFAIALSNVDDPHDAGELRAPIAIAVTALGASELTPSPVMIGRLGQWQTVSIAVPNPEGKTYRIAVSADPQDPGNAIDLGVLRPVIKLTPTSSHIIGWGIGKTEITVRATGIAAPQGYVVTLHSERGGLSPSSVKLDSAGLGVATLWSDSAGATTVDIADGGVTTQPVTVTFDPPWLFVGMAVLGGLAGAFVRGKGRSNRGRALAIGAALGLIMALAYAVGIDWVSNVFPGADLTKAGEAVVFVLGAVAAIVGVNALVKT